MKKTALHKIQKILLASFVFIFISKISPAQQDYIKPDAPVVIETVVLKFPDINSAKVYNAVTVALAGIEGVTIHGRCVSNEYLLIDIDRRYYFKNDEVLNKIREANLNYEFIANAGAQKLQELCPNIQITK